MRSVQVENLRGNEILARDIFGDGGAILISQGTKLNERYISHLRQLRIFEVLIEDEYNVPVADITEEVITKQYTDVIGRFANLSSMEATDVALVAEEVMADVMRQKEVMYTVSLARDRSRWLYDHMLSVAALSVLLAYRMGGYSKAKLREIAIGAIFHDAGFIDDPDVAIDDMSEEQKAKLQKHVLRGYEQIERNEWISKTSKDIVLMHHERENGSGYPFGRDAAHISSEVKIVAICDEFDTLVYGYNQKKMKVHEVMDYLISNAGVLFDFEMTKTFVRSVAAYPNGSIVKTNEGETGVVVRQNNHFPTRPVVRIINDAEGKDMTRENIEKDLEKELTLFIVDTI